MSWNARYGADPALAEFVAREAGPVRLLIRRGYEEHVARLGLNGGAPEASVVVTGGRRPHPLVELPDGERVVVRRYHRGGALRHLNRDRYFLGHRAFAELRATERARAAGVRVPEVIAAAERRQGLGYSAWLATRWLAGVLELDRWLAENPDGDPGAPLRAAGREIAAMHAGGVAHPDLNLRNLLVDHAADGSPLLYLLDFDRARLYPGEVPRARRERDLRRLARSARKLGAPIGPDEWAALREGYGPAWPLRSELG